MNSTSLSFPRYAHDHDNRLIVEPSPSFRWQLHQFLGFGVGVAQVVKTRVGDDPCLVAELAVFGPGQRFEGAAVPLGNVGSVHGGFPRGVGVQGRRSMPRFRRDLP